MLLVRNAIPKAINHDAAIIHTLKGALQAKFCSQLFIKYRAIGEAMKNGITTSFKKSFNTSPTTPAVLAPKTLRMPISLVSVKRYVNPATFAKASACKFEHQDKQGVLSVLLQLISAYMP